MQQSTGTAIFLDSLEVGDHLCLLSVADTIFLRDNVVPTGTINLPIFGMNDLPYYNGEVVVTNLNNAEYVMKTNGNVTCTFIVWDLEWMRSSSSFTRNVSIYRSVNKLIAKSEDHAKAIENYSNRYPDGIAEYS